PVWPSSCSPRPSTTSARPPRLSWRTPPSTSKRCWEHEKDGAHYHLAHPGVDGSLGGLQLGQSGGRNPGGLSRHFPDTQPSSRSQPRVSSDRVPPAGGSLRQETRRGDGGSRLGGPDPA